ncbi:muscle M-line assembly protein unc-89-like isoform X2 [Hemicordylus capensis]|uniref:muscle M-line assembly protein unc-89-like isoform X2 n=1 Tax=Hemicordylus capensis TaxID=884348 RepID=UPI00230332F7|nr:muscle M-line assembly protein unc-89-like isoform X2 [Hemicordylus capensis]
MEKFFTPVPQAKEGKGASELALRDCRCRRQWTEGRSDRFSTLSSSSASTSASSSAASWSSEASLDKEAFLLTGSRYHSRHSRSCVDVSGEAKAFRPGQDADASYPGEEAGGSFAQLQRGQSRSADRLARRQGHPEAPSLPTESDGVDRHLYKAISLERSLMFNEQAEILAPRPPHQAGAAAPGKSILKNGAVAGGDRLRKAKSIETITVRPAGREPRSGPEPPARPLQRQKQPPSSLDLSAPQKPPAAERMKLVEEKLRFSEFLNEITRQVISPSNLSSLGWKPPEAPSAGQAPSSDGSESKGSSSKGSSPGSLLEMADGRGKEEKAPRGWRRPGQLEAKGDTVPNRHHHHHHQLQHKAGPAPARTTDEVSTSRELGPFIHPSASLGSLPTQMTETGMGQRKSGEVWAGKDAEDHQQPPKKDTARVAEKPNGKSPQESVAVEARTHSKELLAEMNTEQQMSPPEEEPALSAQKGGEGSKSGLSQRDLQKTWEELEALKEKFSRLQEDYSSTRHTNQLLEDKLQIIISGLLSGPHKKHRRSEKAESPDSLCSLRIVDVAPPPAFMDGASDARTTPSQSDSATETSKLGCSSESDTAAPNGDRTSLREYGILVPPVESLKRHSKSHARVTAFTPWKQKSTKFSAEQMNSTESECSGEETFPLCPPPAPRFLYLRQEALVAASEPSSLPPLPAPESVGFEVGRPHSPTGQAAGGQLELVLELNSSESSDDEEVSWNPGLVEKTTLGSPLDYHSAQKMLDSLLQKSSEQEKSREKAARKMGRPGGYRLAGFQEGSNPGRLATHQHRIRYYQDFPNAGEESPEEKSYPHGVGSLTRGTKGMAVGLEGRDAAQDSTSL